MAAFFIREVLIQCRNLSVKLSSKVGMDTGLGEAQPILTALGGQDSTRDTRDSVGDTRDSQGFALSDLELFIQRSKPVTGSPCPHGKKKVGTSSFLKSSSVPVWENNEERKPILRGLWCVTGAELWDVNEVAEFHLGIAPTLSKELVCDSLMGAQQATKPHC